MISLTRDSSIDIKLKDLTESQELMHQSDAPPLSGQETNNTSTPVSLMDSSEFLVL
jgi:hypothetical protein